MPVETTETRGTNSGESSRIDARSTGDGGSADRRTTPSSGHQLSIYQFRSAVQSGGSGEHDRMSLMMRRSPRVNHEVLLRATFLG